MLGRQEVRVAEINFVHPDSMKHDSDGTLNMNMESSDVLIQRE